MKNYSRSPILIFNTVILFFYHLLITTFIFLLPCFNFSVDIEFRYFNNFFAFVNMSFCMYVCVYVSSSMYICIFVVDMVWRPKWSLNIFLNYPLLYVLKWACLAEPGTHRFSLAGHQACGMCLSLSLRAGITVDHTMLNFFHRWWESTHRSLWRWKKHFTHWASP